LRAIKSTYRISFEDDKGNITEPPDSDDDVDGLDTTLSRLMNAIEKVYRDHIMEVLPERDHTDNLAAEIFVNPTVRDDEHTGPQEPKTFGQRCYLARNRRPPDVDRTTYLVRERLLSSLLPLSIIIYF
jgi:hypothetical protein